MRVAGQDPRLIDILASRRICGGRRMMRVGCHSPSLIVCDIDVTKSMGDWAKVGASGVN